MLRNSLKYIYNQQAFGKGSPGSRIHILFKASLKHSQETVLQLFNPFLKLKWFIKKYNLLEKPQEFCQNSS